MKFFLNESKKIFFTAPEFCRKKEASSRLFLSHSLANDFLRAVKGVSYPFTAETVITEARRSPSVFQEASKNGRGRR